MYYEKVIAYCKKNNMAVSTFEEKCGIGNGTIGRWKNGASKPSLSTLEKINKALKIPEDYWFRPLEEEKEVVRDEERWN